MRVSRVVGGGYDHAAGVAAEHEPLDHNAMDGPFCAKTAEFRSRRRKGLPA
jgi:hypothetical protein